MAESTYALTVTYVVGRVKFRFAAQLKVSEFRKILLYAFLILACVLSKFEMLTLLLGG